MIEFPNGKKKERKIRFKEVKVPTEMSGKIRVEKEQNREQNKTVKEYEEGTIGE